MRAALDREADAVRMQLLAERRLLEAILEPFALGDLECGANAFVVGAKAHEAAGERLVGAVAFAGPGKRSVQLESRLLRSAADEAASEQPQPAGGGGVAAARADHHRADDVEEGDHLRKYIARTKQPTAKRQVPGGGRWNTTARIMYHSGTRATDAGAPDVVTGHPHREIFRPLADRALASSRRPGFRPRARAAELQEE